MERSEGFAKEELDKVEEGLLETPSAEQGAVKEGERKKDLKTGEPAVASPGEQYALRAPSRTERTTKRIVFPWGTQVSTIEQDGSITVSPASFGAVSPRSRYQLIRQTLDMKRQSLGRIETAPAKQLTGLFRYASNLGRAPLGKCRDCECIMLGTSRTLVALNVTG